MRMKARDELHEAEFSGDEGLELLRASALDFGEDSDSLFPVAAQIVLAVKPEPRTTAIVEQLFPSWPPATKAAGLNLLSRIGDDASTKAFVRLLPTLATGDADLLFGGLRKKPHHAELVIPALLALEAKDELRDELYLTLVAYCDEHQLNAAIMADRAPALLATYRRVIEDINKRQRGAHWLRDEGYADPRERASLLLDLFRCVPGDEVVSELTAALANRDPRLEFFAAKSLRALGRTVPDPAFARIASTPEMRNWLIEELAKTHEVERIPARYRSQAAIAEAEMVQWLVYPTELGHVPDAIELAKVVSVNADYGLVDLYVFKILTDDGWVAGVAGPYLRKDEPTTESRGGTFSGFEPWASKTPEQHAAQLSDLIEKSVKRRAADKRDTVQVPDSDARDRKP